MAPPSNPTHVNAQVRPTQHELEVNGIHSSLMTFIACRNPKAHVAKSLSGINNRVAATFNGDLGVSTDWAPKVGALRLPSTQKAN